MIDPFVIFLVMIDPFVELYVYFFLISQKFIKIYRRAPEVTENYNYTAQHYTAQEHSTASLNQTNQHIKNKPNRPKEMR